MFEYIHVYAKVDCPFCKDAITLLEERRESFVVTVLDHCSEFEAGIKKELNFPTVPIILKCFEDGKVQMIGGYTELQSYCATTKELSA
jgi:glutaredoxin